MPCILKFSLTTVLLPLFRGCSARLALQHSRGDRQLVWVSRFFRQEIWTGSWSSWLSELILNVGPGRSGCHCDSRLLIRAGFLFAAGHFSVLQGQLGGALAGIQLEISVRKLEVCIPTCVSQLGIKRSVKCHCYDRRNYGMLRHSQVVFLYEGGFVGRPRSERCWLISWYLEQNVF